MSISLVQFRKNMVNLHIADDDDQSLLQAQEILVIRFQIIRCELFDKRLCANR